MVCSHCDITFVVELPTLKITMVHVATSIFMEMMCFCDVSQIVKNVNIDAT